jgi:hypothetical protein
MDSICKTWRCNSDLEYSPCQVMDFACNTACDTCGSFKRRKLLQTIQQAALDKSQSTFRRSGLSINLLKESAASCHCCKVLLNGTCGILEDENVSVPEVRSLDIELEYKSLVGGDEPDCLKTITLNLRDGKHLVIEFFTLESDGESAHIIENLSNQMKIPHVRTAGMIFTSLSARLLKRTLMLRSTRFNRG